MKVSISDPAKLDLANIIAYLIGLNRRSADKLSALFEEKIASLALFPERGVRRPALSKNARVLMVETYLVIYRIELDHVLVLRVLDGRMDIEAEFIE
jgi:toxin ParE1/3/4